MTADPVPVDVEFCTACRRIRDLSLLRPVGLGYICEDAFECCAFFTASELVEKQEVKE